MSRMDNMSLFGTEDIDKVQEMYENMTHGRRLPKDFSILDSIEPELDWELEEVIHMTDKEFENWLRFSLELNG